MTDNINNEIYVKIKANCDYLAEDLIELLREAQWELNELYSIIGYKKCKQLTVNYLSYLAESIGRNEILIFTDFLEWLKVVIKNIGIDAKHIPTLLRFTDTVFNRNCTALESAVVTQYIKTALHKLRDTATDIPTFINNEHQNFSLAKDYLNHILNGEKQNATDLILDAVHNGLSINDLYIDVFQCTQYEIGRLWQLNKISVAQEHYCTALTQVIMSQLYPYILNSDKIKNGHKFIATCITNELHDLGVKMVSDFLEIDGWNSYFLGSNVPAIGMLKAIEQENPKIVGISASLALNLSPLEALINEIRKNFGHKDLKIIVGGYLFNAYSNLWSNIGADGYSKDARDAVTLCNHLIERRQDLK